MIVRRLVLIALSAVSTLTVHASEGQHSFPERNQTLPDADPAAVCTAVTTKVEILTNKLNFPNSVELDDQGNVWVALAGAGHGNPGAEPAILRLQKSGKHETVIQEGGVAPVNDLLWHEQVLYISHRGKISAYEAGNLRDLVTGLPGKDDHTNDQIDFGPDKKLCITQGRATNSGVVGADNKKWVNKHPDFHDLPAETVTFVDRTFESRSFLRQ